MLQYADDTAGVFAAELLDGATADTTIGVVSAPSAFVALKNALVSNGHLELFRDGSTLG